MSADMIQQACDMLGHADGAVRRSAQEQLIAAGTVGIAALKEAVNHPTPRVSFSAAQALAQVDDPWRFESMAAVLRSRNPLVGELATKTLASYGERAVETLVAALPHCHPLVQVNVVLALEHIGSQKAIRPLMTLLATTNFTTLRYLAIQALGVLGDPAAAPLIRTFSDDPDQHVRQRVILALQRLAGNES
jgi:HEAT repeat protein